MTQLKRSGAYYSGRCPLPGCSSRHDALNLKLTPQGWRWFCRKCGDGKYHTPFDFVMRLKGISFKEAFILLGGTPPEKAESAAPPVPPPAQPAQPPPPEPPDEWQRAAWRLVDSASDCLLHEAAGEPGREYLRQRGLLPATQAAWLLGYTQFYDPKARRTRPAIVLPWWTTHPERALYPERATHPHGDRISAVKLRFIDPEPDGLRYTSLKGSQPLLFGLAHALPTDETLLLLEGEFNALSAWQCLPAGVSVLSFGSEGGARPWLLRGLARRYRRIFVWLDEREKARAARELMARSLALRSPEVNGRKLDANEMLKAGFLPEFLARVLQKQG